MSAVQPNTPCGTRTRNLRIRSPTPCPLGQGGCRLTFVTPANPSELGFKVSAIYEVSLPLSTPSAPPFAHIFRRCLRYSQLLLFLPLQPSPTVPRTKEEEDGEERRHKKQEIFPHLISTALHLIPATLTEFRPPSLNSYPVSLNFNPPPLTPNRPPPNFNQKPPTYC